jgi:uncharacterized protein (TIGR04255 family)
MHVTLPPGVTTDALAQIQVGQEATYPHRGNLFFQETQLVAGSGVSPASGPTLVGHSFHSRDGKQIIRARLGEFFFSRLQPYEGWEQFRNEARRMWEVYGALAKPEAITRVAVRFVNRLDIALADARLKDYLRALPDLPEGLPPIASDFFMQVQVPQEELQGMLILNEGTLKPAPPGITSILLDIDLFREKDLPQEEAALWGFVERLRLRKNQVFEECITDRTRELIQ